MRKKALAIVCAVLVIVPSVLYLCIPIQYKNDLELIKKARDEMPISEADTVEIKIAGKIEDNDKCLIWFISGNDYQSHYYLPLEFIVSKDKGYIFSRKYVPMRRGMDISVLNWNSGITFCVNNPRCNNVQITAETEPTDISINQYPYVSYYSKPVSSYAFFDEKGKEIR